MTAKEWLSRARRMSSRLRALQTSKEQSYARAVSSAAGLGERVSGGLPADKLAAYTEVGRVVDRQVEKLEHTRAEILQVIGRIEDNTLSTLLTEYYVNDKTWAQIAAQQHYSWRQVMRLHGHALQIIRELTGLE